MTYRPAEEIRALLEEAAELLRQHLALGRTELRRILVQLVVGLGFLVGAAWLGFGLLLFLPFLLTLLLALWLPLWLAALVLFLLTAAGSAALLWTGVRRIRAIRVQALPTMLEEDIQWIRKFVSSWRRSEPSGR